jgi:2-polyprenyl-3-methyl-5-hydroxy-6-metoxy-1,4-benzoquinol methylase
VSGKARHELNADAKNVSGGIVIRRTYSKHDACADRSVRTDILYPSDMVKARARLSLGSSNHAIYQMVADALASRGIAGGCLIDVGCGAGGLWHVLTGRFDRYSGLDAVRYPALPPEVDFTQMDLDATEWPVPEADADVVAAVETIEHLENPWAFVRSLARIAKPGGWIVVTTPNQLSALSLATLLVKRRFSAFQDSQYPAHRTALLESDLVRIVAAAGLEQIAVAYSCRGRLPLTAAHVPAMLARRMPRVWSDNLLVIGRKPNGR